MMFKRNFIVNIKANGKILREMDNVVTLPFGSEYEIFLKNLNSRKAKIDITIDGKDALTGEHLLLRGNCNTTLKGYLVGNSVKNKFKFIQKTKEIADYRGDFEDDGIIRVEYWFEKKCVTERVDIEHHHHDVHHYHEHIPYYRPIHPRRLSFGDNGTGGAQFSSDFADVTCYNVNSDLTPNGTIDSGKATLTTSGSLGICELSVPQPNEGITVKGSKTNQQFNTAYIGELEEQSSVITLKLRGYTGTQNYVVAPMTVKTKLTCETCGHKSKSNAKFCSNCGTSLI